MRPEDALPAARAAATAARERGAYGDTLDGLSVAPTDHISTETLLEWATIEPDLDAVRSTRRLGGPITFVKRALVKAMRQYNADLLAQQTRFNLHVVVRIAELEERLERAERERREA